jgi:hypothetical protein
MLLFYYSIHIPSDIPTYTISPLVHYHPSVNRTNCDSIPPLILLLIIVIIIPLIPPPPPPPPPPSSGQVPLHLHLHLHFIIHPHSHLQAYNSLSLSPFSPFYSICFGFNRNQSNKAKQTKDDPAAHAHAHAHGHGGHGGASPAAPRLLLRSSPPHCALRRAFPFRVSSLSTFLFLLLSLTFYN